MKRLSLLAIVATLSLTACTSEAERQAAIDAQKAYDRAECSELGFEPKTEMYSNCLLKLREIRAQERTAAAARRGHYSIGFGGRGGFGRYHW